MDRESGRGGIMVSQGAEAKKTIVLSANLVVGGSLAALRTS